MGKTPYQKRTAKQKKAEKKVDNKPKKKRLLKAVVSVLALTFVLGAIHFGTYALTTNNAITWNGYTNYLQNVLVLEETVEERDTLQEDLILKQAQVTTLTAQKTALEAEVEAKNAAIVAKDAEIAANLALIAAQEQDLLANATTIAALESANATLEAEKLDLQADVDALTADLQTVNEQLAIANASILDLQATIAAKDAEIESLQAYIAQLEAFVINDLYILGEYFGTFNAVTDAQSQVLETGLDVTFTLTKETNGTYTIDGQWTVGEQELPVYINFTPWYDLGWNTFEMVVFQYSHQLFTGQDDVRGSSGAQDPIDPFVLFVNNQDWVATQTFTQTAFIELKNGMQIYLPYTINITMVEAEQIQTSVLITNAGNTLLDAVDLNTDFHIEMTAIVDMNAETTQFSTLYFVNGTEYFLMSEAFSTPDLILVIESALPMIHDGQLYVTVNDTNYALNLWNDAQWKFGELLQSGTGSFYDYVQDNLSGFALNLHFVLEVVGEDEIQQISNVLMGIGSETILYELNEEVISQFPLGGIEYILASNRFNVTVYDRFVHPITNEVFPLGIKITFSYDYDIDYELNVFKGDTFTIFEQYFQDHLNDSEIVTIAYDSIINADIKLSINNQIIPFEFDNVYSPYDGYQNLLNYFETSLNYLRKGLGDNLITYNRNSNGEITNTYGVYGNIHTTLLRNQQSANIEIYSSDSTYPLIYTNDLDDDINIWLTGHYNDFSKSIHYNAKVFLNNRYKNIFSGTVYLDSSASFSPETLTETLNTLFVDYSFPTLNFTAYETSENIDILQIFEDLITTTLDGQTYFPGLRGEDVKAFNLNGATYYVTVVFSAS